MRSFWLPYLNADILFLNVNLACHFRSQIFEIHYMFDYFIYWIIILRHLDRFGSLNSMYLMPRRGQLQHKYYYQTPVIQILTSHSVDTSTQYISNWPQFTAALAHQRANRAHSYVVQRPPLPIFLVTSPPPRLLRSVHTGCAPSPNLPTNWYQVLFS
jgi:hypothetical protein